MPLKNRISLKLERSRYLRELLMSMNILEPSRGVNLSERRSRYRLGCLRFGWLIRAALFLTAILALSPASGASFPPNANAAWVYDPPAHNGSHGAVKPGYFVDTLTRYNDNASSGALIRELYVYGGDMEMYCPNHEPKLCQTKDFHVYYSYSAQHNDAKSGGTLDHENSSVRAYALRFGHQTFPGGGRTFIVPVIDGTVSEHGTLQGFDELSREQAAAFADKVAHQVCADGLADGVQFDLEPFNVTKKAGQYYFYKKIAQDFASSAMGCVDSHHPHGRFFSIFTVANRIRPNTPSADHVQKIMQVAGNGYLIDALYDLQGTPPGHQTSFKAYRKLVQRETQNMRNWAARIGLKYQFGVPAAAAAHEFAACRGVPCRLSNTNAQRNNDDAQLTYAKSAVDAIRSSGAMQDSHYLGIALWAWSPGLHFKGMQFSPTEPPASVRRYLSKNLADKQ